MYTDAVVLVSARDTFTMLFVEVEDVLEEAGGLVVVAAEVDVDEEQADSTRALTTTRPTVALRMVGG